jgi:hypothetical protein
MNVGDRVAYRISYLLTDGTRASSRRGIIRELHASRLHRDTIAANIDWNDGGNTSIALMYIIKAHEAHLEEI